jgi:hypothetical protein
VGANGKAFIFHRSGTGWVEHAVLTSGESPARQFGFSVAISGNYAIVGTDDLYYSASNPGAAYIFFYNGTSWIKQAKLTPGIVLKGGGTRQSVSISGDYAIIGEVTTPNDFSETVGKAYIFRRNGTQWDKQPDVQSPPAPTRFGWSVSIGQNYAVIGDPWDSKGGAVYLVKHDGSQVTKIKSSDFVFGDAFGQSVSIDGNVIRNTILVGAPFKKVGAAGYYQGAAYTYYIRQRMLDFGAIFDRYTFCKNCPPPPCLQCPLEISPEEWQILPPFYRDFYIGVALSQFASSITDDKMRQEIQQAAFNMMRKARQHMAEEKAKQETSKTR